jgi:hypothetical protein
VAYFSAAGNDGLLSYDNPTPVFSQLSNAAPNAGEYLLNFDNSGATYASTLSIDIPVLKPGYLLALVLQWDQPYVTGASGSPGASSHLDLCVTGVGNDTLINLNGTKVTCSGANATGNDPVQVLIISNPANAAAPTSATTISVSIGLADGTVAPHYVKLAVEANGLAGVVVHSNYAENPTLQGHSGAAGAATVGAAAFYRTPGCGITTAVLESYSARGGSPVLFDTTGTRLATQVVRTKPNFVGPDGGNDTFLGFKITAGEDTSTVAQCANNASYPNFFGTSAAAPHAAGIAALMLQANSNLTPAQIYGALQKSALPMGSITPDFNSGYGFIQADAALATLPPGAPTLKLASTSIAPGATTTLTWSSINTTNCTASGDWTGTQATSGGATITAPATAGTTAYTLTCSNANGMAASTANLTIAAPSKGGGGGALNGFVLLVLGSLGVARLMFARTVRSG